MKEKSTFCWLNTTQFFGALNDNVFKFLIILFLIGYFGEAQASNVNGIVGLIFVLPFILFSYFAGFIADKYSKRNIIIFTKCMEIVVMLTGATVFYFQSIYGLYFVVFMMSLQSTLFGPSKYGIIPELVSPKDLSKANSLLCSYTFIAIIIGTGMAPMILKFLNYDYKSAGLICSGIALIGTISSFKIKKTRAFHSNKPFNLFFIKEIFNTFCDLSKDKHLFLAVIGASYFLFIGAFVQLNIIGYGIHALNLSKDNSAYLFMVIAIGIGIGSYLAGKLSGKNIEFGIVPIGSFGITLCSFALFFINNVYYALVVVLLLGISAGLFIIPLHAFIQYRSPENRRGEILASENFLGFIGVLAASLLLLFLANILNMSAASGFLFISGFNTILLILTLFVLPDFLLRFFALVVMRIFYRIDLQGEDNIPMEGPALLISNHISWIDALLLVATTQRRIRFMMDSSIFSHKWLNPLFKLMGVIPVSGSDSPKKVVQSLTQARKVLDQGYMVCIFAEGKISRSGNLNEFKKGFERILKGRDYPIIPIYIGGAWGSMFSYFSGRVLSQMPKMIPYPVSIIYGNPLPASAKAEQVRTQVMELASRWFEMRKTSRESLSRVFIKTARQNAGVKSMVDVSGKTLKFKKVLVSVIALSDKIVRLTENDRYVGILFPASIGGALVNVAVTMAGKTAVNINFTSGENSIKSAVKQCQINTIITSKQVVKNLKNFPVEDGMVYIEDILKDLSIFNKITAFIKAKFFPVALIDKNKRYCGDDTAAIIFSSGTTSDPKGVELTHHNIMSNIESLRSVLKLNGKDNLMSVLPFFHSFGYTASIWLPLISGFSSTYHPKPLDVAKIVKLIRKNSSTVLISTPTFLGAYMRKAGKEDFATLRHVIVGAAKLSTRLFDAFVDKYGISLLEGYGATELSPMATVNIPNLKIDGVSQVGTKIGTVGHPLPGVSVKIVDPDTKEVLSQGESGLLMIKGPNVMKGYLNNEEKTAQVIENGWYNTGDIAVIDKDGFITITDRLSRFSKIGGEMVPHIAVEEKFHQLLKTEEQVLAITSVADEKKGEQLVVVYTDKAGSKENLNNLIQSSDLSNLWKPKKDCYINVSDIPVLGSGKLDLKKIKNLAVSSLTR